VPDEVFTGLFGQLVALAMKGHYPALKLSLEYLVGKPERGVPADEVDIHELELALRKDKLERQCRRLGVPVPASEPASAAPPQPTQTVITAEEAEVTPETAEAIEQAIGRLTAAVASGRLNDALRHMSLVNDPGELSRPDAQGGQPTGSKRCAAGAGK